MSGTMKTYEGMFLLDAGNSDFDAASEPVRSMLTKHNAETISIKPWEDRRLCYEIEGRKRGLYILVYFKADPEVLTEIEHDCQLSENILRILILRRDKLTEEEIKAETPASSMSHRPVETKIAEIEESDVDVEAIDVGVEAIDVDVEAIEDAEIPDESDDDDGSDEVETED